VLAPAVIWEWGSVAVPPAETMCKRPTLSVVLIAGCLSLNAFGRSSGPNPVLTGTVNIVLANSNGIVVVTDSNQTTHLSSGQPFTSPSPGQKLFRIDDRTVCTIAGFGSTTLPRFPDFTSSAAGILDRYVEQLRATGETHSFGEKLRTLFFLFTHQLTGIGNLQHLDSRSVGDYGFQLILAGYDSDGTAKLGKLVLSTSLSLNGVFSPVLKEMTETTVGRELAHETAGLGGAVVEAILAHPAAFPEDPVVRRYGASKASDHGSSLTTSEMESLARSLARHSAQLNTYVYQVKHQFGSPFDFRTFWPIGGRDQIAVLEKGLIQKIEQPTHLFEARRVSTAQFAMVVGLGLDGNGRPGMTLIGPGNPIGLYLKAHLVGGIVHLDNTYYFEDEFRNDTLYYDGGVLGFDPSNRVIDCVLKLGPNVERKSSAVQELIAGFPWKSVQEGNLLTF